MKKWIIIAIAIILLIALTLSLLMTWLRMAFKVAYRLLASIDMYSRKISQPQNVYEEIWNLLLTEERTSKNTVLTTSTEDAEVDWEALGGFEGVHIPECHMSIRWWTYNNRETELYFTISRSSDWHENARYIYNRTTNTLYGDTAESFLLDNFIKDYFQWCEDAENFSSDYSMEDMGDVTFQYVEDLWDREQSN
jgi:hypothetical protein